MDRRYFLTSITAAAAAAMLPFKLDEEAMASFSIDFKFNESGPILIQFFSGDVMRAWWRSKEMANTAMRNDYHIFSSRSDIGVAQACVRKEDDQTLFLDWVRIGPGKDEDFPETEMFVGMVDPVKVTTPQQLVLGLDAMQNKEIVWS